MYVQLLERGVCLREAARLEAKVAVGDVGCCFYLQKKRSLSKSRSLCVLEDGAPLDFLSNNTLSHVLQTRGTTKDRRTEASPAGIYRSLRAKPGRLAEDAQGRIIVPFDEEGESAEETAVGFEEKEGKSEAQPEKGFSLGAETPRS